VLLPVSRDVGDVYVLPWDAQQLQGVLEAYKQEGHFDQTQSTRVSCSEG
jgi:hypothetical protein